MTSSNSVDETPLDLVRGVLANEGESIRTELHAAPVFTDRSAPPPAEDIVADLLAQALATSGVRDRAEWKNLERFSGGNTAEWVGRLDLTVPCVLKLDRDRKVVEEARVLREASERHDLPPAFRACLPRIYAIRDSPPVFAYLMETFPKSEYVGLEELLFAVGPAGDDPPSERGVLADRLTNRLLDLLLSAYRSSRNVRLRPSIFADYVDRIRGRLLEAIDVDEAFLSRRILSKAHGRTYLPWQDYLHMLDGAKQQIEALAPPFTTFVHGDPNPENILGRVDVDGVDLRFIDVKEWHNGDYMFDVAKFLHYLLVTGPIEKLDPTSASAEYTLGRTEAVIEHDLPSLGWASGVHAIFLQRVGEFARTFGDEAWEQRLTLGLASNLLGLPAVRIKNGKRISALICYIEGLRYLDDFCRQQELLA